MQEKMTRLSLDELSEIIGGIRHKRFNNGTCYNEWNLAAEKCWNLLDISIRNGNDHYRFYVQKKCDINVVRELNNKLRSKYMLGGD